MNPQMLTVRRRGQGKFRNLRVQRVLRPAINLVSRLPPTSADHWRVIQALDRAVFVPTSLERVVETVVAEVPEALGWHQDVHVR